MAGLQGEALLHQPPNGLSHPSGGPSVLPQNAFKEGLALPAVSFRSFFGEKIGCFSQRKDCSDKTKRGSSMFTAVKVLFVMMIVIAKLLSSPIKFKNKNKVQRKMLSLKIGGLVMNVVSGVQ